MAQIVITEFMEAAAVEGLAADFDVLFDAHLFGRPDDLAEAARDARVLVVRNRTQVRDPLLASAPRLEAVGRLGVGLDNIDLDACAARGIAVLPATGANAGSVAEYVLAGVLMLLRGAYHSTNDLIAGRWPHQDLIGREAAGRRLGLVGFGVSARAVAAKATALGMEVVAHDPYVAAADADWARLGVAPRTLAALLGECDAVSLHVPLLETTRHLIDAAALALMRPGSVLVNAARGGVVDEAALVDSLRTGRLGGAMLDVFADEPLADGSAFEAVPNLILTPHIAGRTGESDRRVSALTAANVRRVLEGGSR